MQKQPILKESCCLCIEGVRGQKERANKKIKKTLYRRGKNKTKTKTSKSIMILIKKVKIN